MTVNELRIGNYLNTPRADQSPFRIDVIEFASKNNIKVGMNVNKLPHPFNENEFIDAHPFTWELQDLKPIELTEEILVKCGFEKHSTNPFWFRKKQICISLAESLELISWDMQIFKIDLKVKYLHQLQNLYFALTGEELEINL